MSPREIIMRRVLRGPFAIVFTLFDHYGLPWTSRKEFRYWDLGCNQSTIYYCCRL